MLSVEGAFKSNNCLFYISTITKTLLNDLKYGVKSTAVEKIQELLLVCISSTGWKITDSVNSQLIPSTGSMSSRTNSCILKLEKGKNEI